MESELLMIAEDEREKHDAVFSILFLILLSLTFLDPEDFKDNTKNFADKSFHSLFLQEKGRDPFQSFIYSIENLQSSDTFRVAENYLKWFKTEYPDAKDEPPKKKRRLTANNLSQLQGKFPSYCQVLPASDSESLQPSRCSEISDDLQSQGSAVSRWYDDCIACMWYDSDEDEDEEDDDVRPFFEDT